MSLGADFRTAQAFSVMPVRRPISERVEEAMLTAVGSEHAEWMGSGASDRDPAVVVMTASRLLWTASEPEISIVGCYLNEAEWVRSGPWRSSVIQFRTPAAQFRVTGDGGWLAMAQKSAAAPTLADAGMAPSSPIDWQEAERMALAHIHALGFRDASLTQPGADSGIDVAGAAVAAQVKNWTKPVGRPEVQRLAGAAALYANKLYYSKSGYTAEAIRFADERRICLFSYGQGRVFARNAVASALADGTSLAGTPWRLTDRQRRDNEAVAGQARVLRSRASAARTVAYKRAATGEIRSRHLRAAIQNLDSAVRQLDAAMSGTGQSLRSRQAQLKSARMLIDQAIRRGHLS